MSLVYINTILAFAVSLIDLLMYGSHLIWLLLCVEGIILSIFVIVTAIILNTQLTLAGITQIISICCLQGWTGVITSSCSIQHLQFWLCTKISISFNVKNHYSNYYISTTYITIKKTKLNNKKNQPRYHLSQYHNI